MLWEWGTLPISPRPCQKKKKKKICPEQPVDGRLWCSELMAGMRQGGVFSFVYISCKRQTREEINGTHRPPPAHWDETDIDDTLCSHPWALEAYGSDPTPAGVTGGLAMGAGPVFLFSV
ncbi:merlin-like [Platysternon megacephalum]|uniref:Merlin-like n=1 Tax=Platysternon megacephalum TaxID=55544 RepID=A0A4D9F1R3_9SAUR|nr:merlin-like [Platysternon megacephalum]